MQQIDKIPLRYYIQTQEQWEEFVPIWNSKEWYTVPKAKEMLNNTKLPNWYDTFIHDYQDTTVKDGIRRLITPSVKCNLRDWAKNEIMNNPQYTLLKNALNKWWWIQDDAVILAALLNSMDIMYRRKKEIRIENVASDTSKKIKDLLWSGILDN